MRRWIIGALVAPTLLACGEKLHDGAIDIFARVNTCPANRLKVTARKDVPPHTVLKMPTVADPPPDVAADPERMKMWRNQHKVPDVDAIGHTFEVTGCEKTTRFVCAHPRTDWDGAFGASVSPDVGGGASVSLNSEYSSSTSAALVVTSNVVESAVVCLPEGSSP